MGPHPAVAEVRRAVRRGLDGLTAGDLVLAACWAARIRWRSRRHWPTRHRAARRSGRAA